MGKITHYLTFLSCVSIKKGYLVNQRYFVILSVLWSVCRTGNEVKHTPEVTVHCVTKEGTRPMTLKKNICRLFGCPIRLSSYRSFWT